jgi:hypothetical protein
MRLKKKALKTCWYGYNHSQNEKTSIYLALTHLNIA